MASRKSQENGFYHLGNLRVELIEAGLRLLETRTADGLGLREVAREVGVTATSVYRHFVDKRALLAALADEGVSRLASAQQAARIGCGDPEKELDATRLAYVRFAREHPALFRIMCSNSGSKLLLGWSVGVDSDMTTLRALATAHGLALLMLNGRIRADGATLDRVSGMATT